MARDGDDPATVIARVRAAAADDGGVDWRAEYAAAAARATLAEHEAARLAACLERAHATVARLVDERDAARAALARDDGREE